MAFRGPHILIRTLSKWLYLIVPLVVYGVAILYALNFESDWTAKQTLVVVVTGFVLIWYTWETMLLRQAAFLQRELQLRPFVVFRREGQRYVVENLGNATALGVCIDAITISESPTKLEIRFPSSLSILKPNAVADIEIEVLINGNKSDPTFAAHLDPKYAIRDVNVHIHFSNIEGKQYSLMEIVSPQTLSITGFRNESAL